MTTRQECGGLPSGEWCKARRPGRPLRIGHRGAAGLAPENTLAAFSAALQCGVDAVECDVQATADGEIIVFHDARLDRLTGLDGTPADWRWSELRRQARVAGQHPIPTLREVCELLEGTGVGLFVEIKQAGLAGNVDRLLRECAAGTSCVVGSFSQDEVAASIALASHPALQLARSGEDFLAAPWQQPRFQVAGIPVATATAETVSLLRQRGLAVWVWTANRKFDIRKAVRVGADAIISDYPDRLAKILP